jgi:hypothetical protein
MERGAAAIDTPGDTGAAKTHLGRRKLLKSHLA